MAHKKCIDEVVWISNISDIPDCKLDSLLTDLESKFIINSLVKKKILQYLFVEDRKRSLLSELLQKARFCSYLKENKSEISSNVCVINRTFQNKPYPVLPHVIDDSYLLCCSKPSSTRSFWNFNVSHHGSWVVMTSNSQVLVGIDVVRVEAQRSAISEFLSIFETHFTSKEMFEIQKYSSNIEKLRMFYTFWSLKEAFIKAIGEGLGFDLHRIQFDCKLRDISAAGKSGEFEEYGNAVIYIDGSLSEHWSFQIFRMVSETDESILSIAKGPLCNSCVEYMSSAWSMTASEVKQECVHCKNENYLNILSESISIEEVTITELLEIISKGQKFI